MECYISGKFVKWRPNSTHAHITSLKQMHRLRVLYIVFKKKKIKPPSLAPSRPPALYLSGPWDLHLSLGSTFSLAY